MKKAIVGSEAKYWSKSQEEYARKIISYILEPGDILISGHCHRGGIDIWAEEIAYSKGCKMAIFPAQKHSWYWYKKRNIQIATECEILYCIEPGYRKSGGYWTLCYTRKLGKPGILMQVDIP